MSQWDEETWNRAFREWPDASQDEGDHAPRGESYAEYRRQVTPMAESVAVRAGRTLGNWNDRHARHDAAAAATLRWRVLDRIAGQLYTMGDR